VDWKLDAGEEADFEAWIIGPLLQMTALMLHEQRAHLSLMNAIGEVCAQLRNGVVALARTRGIDASRQLVERYHGLHPEAAGAWHPDALERLESPEAQQLYVNAEHDGRVGVITLGREAYNWDVDAELNRSVDWLKSAGIERVIVTGDFHLAGQLVGADTSEFFPAFEDAQAGHRVSEAWSRTARRLHEEFAVSVALINGKRCLGGMLELLLHCHYVLTIDGASLGFPEVTLPVVPGMEACHWPFRRTGEDQWPRLVGLLLEGRPVTGAEAKGWLVDAAGPLEDVLSLAWALASGEGGVEKRSVTDTPLGHLAEAAPLPKPTGDAGRDAARRAIYDTVVASSQASLGEALTVQSQHSAAFFATAECRRGVVGSTWAKTTRV
jgi:enoyl-CoA hydratase/carnithine racemase